MVAGRMTGGPPPNGAVDPQQVERGRQLIAELTEIITASPEIMLALKDDLVGFGMTIKQFAGGGQPQGFPPAQGMGAPAGAPPGMGAPPGGPPGPPGGMPAGGMPPGM